jgi:hypothetical protein
VNLQEVDTIQDLREWVKENMPGARVTEDSAGEVVIHTGLTSTMGGYLHEREGEAYGYCIEGSVICPDCAKKYIEKGEELEEEEADGYPDGYTCDDCNATIAGEEGGEGNEY